MLQIKKTIRFVLGNNTFNKLRLLKQFVENLSYLVKIFYADGFLYFKYSTVFKQNTLNKIEALIILKYHALEKGLLHNITRYQFGKQTVTELCQLLKRDDIIMSKNRTQISAAYLAMCTYYELHSENDIDISSYYPRSDYVVFKEYSNSNLSSIKKQHIAKYFEEFDKDFYHFSNSRCSVRDYTNEKIPFITIQKVIELAKNAPSVCNRQPVVVYYVDDKKIIDSIFEIQGGLKGYSEEISNLFVVTCDRNYFYTVGERNQLYIDGGIFLMNLLYALHYYKIAACPAHWGLNIDSDRKAIKLLKISNSEKIICLVAIGIPKEIFNTTLSLRRSSEEILKRV